MNPGSTTVNLTNCDREPIHVPGSIQSHGFLLGVLPDPQNPIAVASENSADYLARPLDAILGRNLDDVISPEFVSLLQNGLLSEGSGGDFSRFIGSISLPGAQGQSREFQIVGHRVNQLYMLEFELTDSSITQADLNSAIANFVVTLENTQSAEQLCRAVTIQVRALTGFDRVMLYRFDDLGHGTVLAEDRNDRLPSYLGLRFPASDIPRQARDLYVLNRIRIIPDVEYTPSPLVSIPAIVEGQSLDLSLSILRSVSPIHRDYMRNMGTFSSMSVSIVSEGKLWGLISGHHSSPKTVPYLVRSACDVLSRIMSAQSQVSEKAAQMSHAISLKSVQSQLLTFMAAGENYIDGIVRHPLELCAVTGSNGAAIVVGDRCVTLGKAPPAEEVLKLANWFSKNLKELFATNELGAEYPDAENLRSLASGVLAISLSRVHRMLILWFRPEVVETVQWAGEPAKGERLIAGVLQIHPRNSFAAWKQIVRGKSYPWAQVEIESAREFRNAVLEVVLKRAEELADMASELAFTNKELEAFSYSVSHDLRAPFRHISGFAELLMQTEADRLSEKGRKYLSTIAESAQFAGLLVDSLLNFSRISRTKLDVTRIPMKVLAEDVWRDVQKEELKGREVEFALPDLPAIMADLNLMRQVWRNLLSNAAKYTRKREKAEIRIAVEETNEEIIFSVHDNGVGFDDQYAHKLFGAFQRLHKMEDFEGTGIGLANVRRIISRMGGRTWAHGQEERGASFFFALPVKLRAQDDVGQDSQARAKETV